MGTLSQDLRERIVAAYDRGEGTRAQIARRYDVSEGMVKKLLQQRRRTGGLAALTHFVLLGSGEKKAYALIGDCTSQQTDDCETPSGDVCRPGSFGGNLDPDYCSPSDVPAENYADVCGSGTDASEDQCWNAGMESEYDDNCNGPGTLDNPDFCEDPWTNPVPDYCNYSAIPPEEMGDISHHG